MQSGQILAFRHDEEKEILSRKTPCTALPTAFSISVVNVVLPLLLILSSPFFMLSGLTTLPVSIFSEPLIGLHL
jgi:hypothetical protein